MSVIESVIDIPAEYMGNIFGSFDANIKKIEKTLKVTIVLRGDALKIIGGEAAVNSAASVFERLIELAKRGNIITEQTVDYTLSLSMEGKEDAITEIDKDVVARTATGKPIKPKTLGQKNYIDEIRKKMIVFGIGPAGTGKTYLAMAMAIQAFKNNEVNRIILTRPAVEAGEKLGFLPGDLSQKVDPYLRPLYDALFEMLGFEKVEKLIERQIIEIAPLAYMRGRTLNDSFIILDEAQNTTVEQMKMFLTRIGFNSRAVITGDPSQIDLPRNVRSGLKQAIEVLHALPEIGFTFFESADVVRHPVVAAIVNAYDAYDKEQAKLKEQMSKAMDKEFSNKESL